MSQMAITHDSGKVPEGWTIQKHPETFSGLAGPCYYRESGAIPGVGFVAEKKHLNFGNVVHGGALLTLADMALWDICWRNIGSFKGVTVTLNGDFLGAGRIDTFIEATGEMTKAGGSLLFARGSITAGEDLLMTFSGTLKRLRDS